MTVTKIRPCSCYVVSHSYSVTRDLHFQVRVYAREEDQERINYAVDAAATIIHYYGSFFNIKYPLPKLGRLLGNLVFTIMPLNCLLLYRKCVFKSSLLLYPKKLIQQ